MNKTIFLCFLLFSFLWSCKNQNVPQNIMDAFSNSYPNATSISWELEESNLWEANFILDKTDYGAVFNNKGVLIEKEHNIKINEIPFFIIDSIKLNYPNYKIDEAELVENTSGRYYELELKRDNLELELLFKANGTFVSENNEKEIDEDD